MTPDNVIETLEAAYNGLKWYRGMMAGAVNGSDDEMDAQIKAAVEWLRGLGVQEPVDTIVRNCCEAEKADPDHPDTICISVQDLTAILKQYTAAPPAQQYEAGDVASAAAQGFRDGVASVAQQQAKEVPEGYKLLKDTTHQDRSWPEDATHENGCYHNTCVNCLRGFTGHKRRGICRSCDALTKP